MKSKQRRYPRKTIVTLWTRAVDASLHWERFRSACSRKRTHKELNSLASQPKWFLVGGGHCHKAGFHFRSIACHLAPKSKSIFIISNLQWGKTTRMARSWLSFHFQHDWLSFVFLGAPNWVGSFSLLQALSLLSCTIRIPKSLNKQGRILHNRPFAHIHFTGFRLRRQRMAIISTLIISFSEW